MKCRFLLPCLVLILWLGTLEASGQQPANQSPKLKVGDPAPDFSLPDQNMKQVKLSDFKGKQNVVLAFYVLAFTGG